MAYKLAVLEILRNLFVLAYIARVRTIPTYRVYRLYDNRVYRLYDKATVRPSDQMV